MSACKKIAYGGCNPYIDIDNFAVTYITTTSSTSTVCSVFDKGYRYGYQGSEKGSEIYENEYTTEFRQLDTRIGRWFSRDLIVKHWESSYALNHNCPILMIDPSGLDPEKTKKGIFKKIGNWFSGNAYINRANKKAEVLRKKDFTVKEEIHTEGYYGFVKLKLSKPSDHSQVGNTTKEFNPDKFAYEDVTKVGEAKVYGSIYVREKQLSGSPGDEEIGWMPKWTKSGYDNMTNQSSPDGMQLSVGGNVAGYSGNLNLVYLKNAGLGINVNGGGKLDLTAWGIGGGISSIEFEPSTARDFTTLEGNGWEGGFSIGPVGYAQNRGYSSHLNNPENIQTATMQGISFGIDSKQLFKTKLNIGVSNTYTSKAFILINFK